MRVMQGSSWARRRTPASPPLRTAPLVAHCHARGVSREVQQVLQRVLVELLLVVGVLLLLQLLLFGRSKKHGTQPWAAQRRSCTARAASRS